MNNEVVIDESLDAPGAGLAWHKEKLIQYLVVPVLPIIFNWDRGLLNLQSQISQIVDLVKDLDEVTLSKQVLVPPMFALEDSSRFWSINMVVEHLVIVNLGTYEIIDMLSQENEVERVLGTEKVKPFKNTNHTKNLIVFEKAYSRLIRKNSKQTSVTTKEHPWFGSFTNKQWHAFIGIHNKVHKKQIQMILRLLEKA